MEITTIKNDIYIYKLLFIWVIKNTVVERNCNRTCYIMFVFARLTAIPSMHYLRRSFASQYRPGECRQYLSQASGISRTFRF